MCASFDARSLADEVVERAVTLPKHLHARPAGEVAQAAARHRPVTIELVAGARRANAGSILAVLGLGAVKGTEVLVKVEGPNATAAADEICKILEAPEDEG
jgi:phosphotransferase system HPr (HPr) family protein